MNRAIILDLIRKRQPISRAELARITGIFRSSVSEIVDGLLSTGLVMESRASSIRGRAPRHLTLNDGHSRVLGLRILPDRCELAEAGLRGTIHNAIRFQTPGDPDALADRIAEAVHHLEFRVDMQLQSGYRKLGIAVPGHTERTSNRVLWTPSMQAFSGFDLAAALQKHGLETVIDNEFCAGALSEVWSTPQTGPASEQNFLFVAITDEGAGAGIVRSAVRMDGRCAPLVLEMGHMTVAPEGPMCDCGRRGCWKLYVSNQATWSRYRPEEQFTPERFHLLLEQARRGDDSAIRAIRETSRYVAANLSSIALALNPGRIVFAGRIAAMWHEVTDELQRVIDASGLAVRIVKAAQPDERSILHGAVCLALQDLFAHPQFG